jgi:DNA-binding protein
MRDKNSVADLAFSAYRDMKKSPWKPFLKAAIERNPVSIEGSKDLDTQELTEKLWLMENESIYDNSRLAQPDEVWNYNRGDGIEKAICLISILKNRFPEDEIILKGNEKKVCVAIDRKEYAFQTDKGLNLPNKSDFDF